MLQVIFKPEKDKVDSYGNIVIALDVSKSMLVSDMQGQSRMSAAKQYIYDTISAYPGYNFGLTIFAGESQRVLPLTQERELFASFVSGLDYRNITRQGTDISAALEDSLKNFSEGEGGAILLITDGDEDKIYIPDEIISQFQQKSIAFFVMGVGSLRGGFIPTGDVFTPYEIYNGERVVVKLNESGLRDISTELGGEYISYPDIPDLEEEDIRARVGNDVVNYGFLYISFLFWMSFCALIVFEKYFPHILRPYES